MKIVAFLLFSQAMSKTIQSPTNTPQSSIREAKKPPHSQLLLSKPAGGGFILKMPGRTYQEMGRPDRQMPSQSQGQKKGLYLNQRDKSQKKLSAIFVNKKKFQRLKRKVEIQT